MEGGQAGGANTICAPASTKCLDNALVKVDSEQDFQAVAHSAIARRAVHNPANNPGFVWEFHFKTEWRDESDVPAAYVQWFDDVGGGFIEPAQKRDLGPRRLFVDEIHPNNTMTTREISMEEVCNSLTRIK